MDAPSNAPNRPTKLVNYALALILLLLPFHAFLTVWLSQSLGHYEVLRVWKEVLLLLVAPLGGYVAYKTPDLWRRVRSSWLLWCLAAYVMLQLGLGLVGLLHNQVNGYALVYAWVINLRFVLIFALAYVAASRSDWLHIYWRRLLLAPAALVVAFGLLQRFLLPHDWLRHVGYGAGTITPYTTVDQKLDYVRLQSTLRGPNPLGAYLVLPVTALVAWLLRNKGDKKQLVGITFLSAALVVLLASYSRSAYVGAGLAVLAVVAFVVHGRRARRRLAFGLAALAVLAAGALLLLRTNDHFENTFFHTDEHSQSQTSSNEQRLQAYQVAVDQVLAEPFGRGPGSAGPASEHNVLTARIAENYYLQVAQETGWFGIILFVAILALIGWQLWLRRQDMLARVLLAALIGISFINLTGHAWADDTLALIWWCLAGVALAVKVGGARATNDAPDGKPVTGQAKLKRGKRSHAKA